MKDSRPTGARILIVDDEPSISSALAGLLQGLGFQAHEAPSGERALSMIEHTPYDLVILDIVLPGMNGIELMRRLLQIDPDLPVIVLTGKATTDYAIEFLRLHAIDFLQKPIETRELVAAVQTGLEHHAKIERNRQLLQSLKTALDELCARESTSDAPPLSPAQFKRAGMISLDCKRGLVILGHESAARQVKLTRSEAAVLSFFIDHPRQVLNCAEIVNGALHYDVDDIEAQSIVRPLLHRLRRKLETNPTNPRLIVTMHGRGYMFCP